jgi:hypothetical protein
MASNQTVTGEETSVACPRCDGTGRFGGGACFNCNGACRVKAIAPSKLTRWQVWARPAFDAEKILVCHIKAKDAKSALSKAVAQLNRGTGYVPDTAEVRPS